MVGRVVAGIILVSLGLGLLGSQLPGAGERLLFGAVLLAGWGAAGLGVLAGLRRARIAGMVLASGGAVIAAVVAALANPGGPRIAIDLFFTVGTPHFSWIGVALGAGIFAVLSAIALLALVIGWTPRTTLVPPAAEARQD